MPTVLLEFAGEPSRLSHVTFLLRVVSWEKTRETREV
jgi:hypothetical protein